MLCIRPGETPNTQHPRSHIQETPDREHIRSYRYIYLHMLANTWGKAVYTRATFRHTGNAKPQIATHTFAHTHRTGTYGSCDEDKCSINKSSSTIVSFLELTADMTSQPGHYLHSEAAKGLPVWLDGQRMKTSRLLSCPRST